MIETEGEDSSGDSSGDSSDSSGDSSDDGSDDSSHDGSGNNKADDNKDRHEANKAKESNVKPDKDDNNSSDGSSGGSGSENESDGDSGYDHIKETVKIKEERADDLRGDGQSESGTESESDKEHEFESSPKMAKKKLPGTESESDEEPEFKLHRRTVTKNLSQHRSRTDDMAFDANAASDSSGTLETDREEATEEDQEDRDEAESEEPTVVLSEEEASEAHSDPSTDVAACVPPPEMIVLVHPNVAEGKKAKLPSTIVSQKEYAEHVRSITPKGKNTNDKGDEITVPTVALQYDLACSQPAPWENSEEDEHTASIPQDIREDPHAMDVWENARVTEFTKYGRPWCQVTSRRKAGACYCGSETKEDLVRKLLKKLETEGETNWRDAIRTNQDEYHGSTPRRRRTSSASKKTRKKVSRQRETGKGMATKKETVIRRSPRSNNTFFGLGLGFLAEGNSDRKRNRDDNQAKEISLMHWMDRERAKEEDTDEENEFLGDLDEDMNGVGRKRRRDDDDDDNRDGGDGNTQVL